MTTILKHEATSFEMVVDGMKAAEVLAAAVSADRSIGLTSLNQLLKGNVATSKGFTVVVVGDTPAVDETPVAEPAKPEWTHAALQALHPTFKPDLGPVMVAETPAAPEVDDEPADTTEPTSPVLVFWEDKGDVSDSVLASKTARLTRKWNRIAGSDKLKGTTKVTLHTFKVGRVVSDYLTIHDETGPMYTVFPKKRGDDEAVAEVYHRDDAFETPVVKGGWGYVVRYFMGE